MLATLSKCVHIKLNRFVWGTIVYIYIYIRWKSLKHKSHFIELDFRGLSMSIYVDFSGCDRLIGLNLLLGV